jgi:predicted MFS family arabinose efflux permease
MQKKEKLLLFIIAASQFSNILDFMIILPIGSTLMRVFDLTTQQFGMLVSAYTFSAAASSVAGAFVLDRFDRKQALLFLFGGLGCGTLLCAIAPNFAVLLLARIVAGAFGGMLGALTFSIVGDAIPQERRGAAMGRVMAAFSMAQIAGVPLGLFLAHQLTWHAPFYFIVITSAIVSVLIITSVEPMNGHIAAAKLQNPLETIVEIIQTPNHLKSFLFSVLLMFAGFSIIPFAATYLVVNVGIDESQLQYFYLAGGAATFFTGPYIGRLADRLGKWNVFSIITLISIIPVVLMTNLSAVPIYMAIAVFVMFIVFVSGRFVSSSALITSSVEPRHRGSFLSLNASIQQLAGGLASLMSGALMGKAADGRITGFPLVGLIAVVCSLLCIVVLRQIKMVTPERLPTTTGEETSAAVHSEAL